MRTADYGVVDAVRVAHEQVGSLVTTGTVQMAEGSYSPEPTDRLIVVAENGAESEVWIETLEGSLELEAREFYDDDHKVAYRIVEPGRLDMTFASSRDGDAHEKSARGEIGDDEDPIAIELREEASDTDEVDGERTDNLIEAHLRGTVISNGFALEVDETYSVESRTFEDYVTTAEQWTVDDSLVLAGTTFDFVDVVTREVRSQTGPAEVDTGWRAAGAVLRDGQAHGELRLQVDTEHVRFMLDLPDGPTEIESHNL